MKRTLQINPSNTLIHQYRFAFADPKVSPYPAIVGGYRSGKTFASPLRWLALIDYRRNVGSGCEMFMVEPTYPMVRRVAVPTFNKFFDLKKIKHSYHKTEHIYSIQYQRKQYDCMFVTAKEPDAIIGFSKTDCIIDEFDTLRSEENQEEVYNKCLARLSEAENPTLGIVTTPEGYRRTYEMYENNNPDPLQYLLIRAKTTDNHFLPESYIASLYQKYDKRLVQRYVNAEFVNLNNSQAYYCFERECINPVKVNRSEPIFVGMDFNVNPMTATVFQMNGEHFNFSSEYWIPNSNTRAIAQLIAADYRGCAIYITPDMTGGARKTSADMTDLQILQSFGFQIIGQRNVTEKARMNIVNNVFDKKRITIDPSCKHLINDFEKVTTNDYGQIAKDKDSQLTHISDAAGYGIVAIENKPKQWGIR